MLYKNYSITDKISKVISPVVRKLTDLNSQLTGTKILLLRLYKYVPEYNKVKNNIQNRNVLGDYKEGIQSQIISNMRIEYPFSKVEIFQSRNGNWSSSLNVYGIDMIESLPIEATIMFNGNHDTEPININQHDKIIDVFFDDKDNYFPIIFEVTKFLADFFGKNLINRKVQLTIYRGEITEEMRYHIDNFVKQILTIQKSV